MTVQLFITLYLGVVALFYIPSFMVSIFEENFGADEIIPLLTGGVAAVSIPMSIFYFILAWRAPADQGFTFEGAFLFTAAALVRSWASLCISSHYTVRATLTS